MEAAYTFLVEKFGAEWLILVYLIYQFTYGKVSKLYNTIRSTIPVLMALSSQVEGVDEEAAANTLETSISTPGQLLTHGGNFSDEEIDKMEKIVDNKQQGD